MESRNYLLTEGLSSIKDRIERIAVSAEPVIISGERGTGKELVARMLHTAGPLVALNCACLEPALADSILFGHRRGAFTGAVRDNTGLISEADGGTLFLDEIALLPPGTQSKLLRFMSGGEVRCLGGGGLKHPEVRVITAGNRDLGKMVERGEFPADLRDRLDVLRIHVPPLRLFPDDITRLAGFFINEANRKYNRNIRLGRKAAGSLLDYDWPGNIRELRNTVIRGFVLCPGNIITPEHLDICGKKAEEIMSPRIMAREKMVNSLLKKSGPLRVNDLAGKCGCTPRTVQKEIKKLIEGGAVRAFKHGRSVYYETAE